MIRRKTGALIATSCRLGGMLSERAGAGPGRPRGVRGALGFAFQLSDDIMDLTSSQETLGKEPGQDLREGMFTLPVIHALDGPLEAEELRDLLSAGPPSEGERLERALEIVREPANLARARSAVAGEVDRARMLADRLPEGPARTSLVQLAEFLAVRCGAPEENGE